MIPFPVVIALAALAWSATKRRSTAVVAPAEPVPTDPPLPDADELAAQLAAERERSARLKEQVKAARKSASRKRKRRESTPPESADPTPEQPEANP